MKKKLIKNLLLMLTMVVLCFAVCMTASAEEFKENGFIYEIKDDNAIIVRCDSTVSGNVIIPSTLGGYVVTEINNYAFANNIGITGISIPNSVTKIGNNAFYMCDYITKIILPNSIMFIGDEAFFFCFSLETIELSDENEYFSLDENGVLYNKDKTKLVCYPAAKKNKTFAIPDSVKVVGNSAFCGNANLEEIIIPNSVIAIEDSAFEFCLSLKNLVFPGSIKNVSSFFENVFFGLQTLTISDGVETIDEKYIYKTAMLNDVYIESMDVEIIEDDDYGLLGLTASKENQTKYFEFLHKIFWEQNLNASDLLNNKELYDEWLSHFEELDTKGTTIYCHSGSTAETYAIKHSDVLNYELTHFYEGEWQYDYDNCVKYRKCIHCNELETEEFIPETPAEPDAPADEEVKEPLYVQLIDLIKMFFALIASLLKEINLK